MHNACPPHNVDGNADGNRIPPHHAVSRQTPLKCVVLHRIPPYHALRIRLRTEKVAGSSPAERASESPAKGGFFLALHLNASRRLTDGTREVLLERATMR